ncbi:penicillin-binding transpeptidase domain-containing protein [Pumilibacter muris]|uniref:penicillin-binding transpeptidase domain-containing protein n=1 Tax=Pumilibacter muris TaxID=2941510 RepID=UPI00203B7E6B|nr:penicillin-binding transpeptidase domain-containing protein [Pumilibacter muris]
MQLVARKDLQSRAAEQWYRDLPLAAPRGKILDSTGSVLADNREVYSVYVRPNAVTDKQAVAAALSGHLNLVYDKLLEKISSSRVSEITIKRAVEKNVAEAILAQNLDGVYFTLDSKRYYPASNYLSQILGFTNIDNVGQNGLEGYYDEYLKGVDGFAYTATDIKGHELENNVTKYVPAIPGCDLTLSLDMNIQSFAETAVSNALSEHNAKGASMIVMDCNTGGVVAMASAPGFDLNEPPRDDLNMLNALSKNKMIVDVYEPGSTFKIFTTATALENGAVSDSDRFFCGGARQVDGQRIKCWRSIGHGSQDLGEGVKNSCNCVFMDLALRLGTDKLYDGIRNFGFGSKTNVDFYGESRGLLMQQSAVKTVDLARIGFGQAVAVTPLQLVTAVSAAVNGGTLYEPYFVSQVNDYSGKLIYERQPKEVRKAISPSTSEKLRNMLEKVVSEGGGHKAGVAGYRIGGKTGTAQKYENGHIAQGKYVSSFVGFAPVENPRYVLAMIVDEPGGYMYYGSLVAAPYAGEVFKKIFDYTGLKPSQTDTVVEWVNMPDVLGLSPEEASKRLSERGLLFESDGEGSSVASCVPVPGTRIPKGDVVLIRTE